MELHYSQTQSALLVRVCTFYYLMELHYSQTVFFSSKIAAMFYYLMELHYSQTKNSQRQPCINVLLPYGITLLSNAIKF